MGIYVDSSEQFENANELTTYPFSGCSLVDIDGKRLPDWLIADLHMVVPFGPEHMSSDCGHPAVRLSNAYVSPAVISVCFCYLRRGAVNALSVSIRTRDVVPYFPYRLKKLYGTCDAAGIVSFGNISIPGCPESYRFEGDAKYNAVVHPCCVASARPSATRSIVDLRSGDSVSGDVKIDFSGHIGAEREGNAFRIRLLPGSDKELMSTCMGLSESKDVCGATPIRSINGVAPDEEGNIALWFH